MNMKRKITKNFPKSNGKRVPVAIMFTLMSSAVLFAQQYQWINVTDTYLKNADFSTGTNEGWTDGGGNPKVDGNWKNAEFYKTRQKATQKVFGLRPGNYKLTVRGFHRMQYPDNGTAFNDGTEVIEAYLVAGENEIPFVSLYSAPKVEGLPGLRDGWPNSMESQMRYCEAYPDAYNNVLEFTVGDNGEMMMGVDMRGGEWTCWDDFKLYFDGLPIDAFKMQLDRAVAMRDSLNTLGIAAASEMSGLINKYSGYDENTSEEDLKAAEGILSEKVEVSLAICVNANLILKDIPTAENIYAKLTDGAYTVTEEVKEVLKKAIEDSKQALLKPTLEEASAALTEGVPMLAETIKNTNAVIGLGYSLQMAKNLADKIGGLSETEEYKKVVADLNSAALAYDEVVTDVTNLNAVCKEKITPEFLSTATLDKPIDMTSFITNPNIFQNGDKSSMPGGWVMLERGSSDNKDLTVESYTDTELHCSSWSDNDANNICKGHYQQLIGGEGSVPLPDGVYQLSAATYADNDIEKVPDLKLWLYATSDSVNFSKKKMNLDADVYESARVNMETTTTVQNVVVVGGKLYIGIKGEGRSGMMGAQWKADNFRLSYVGSDAMEAYRERLAGRLAEGEILHDSLFNYGIDDMDYLGMAVDKEDGYWAFLEGEWPLSDVVEAVDQMDEYIADAKKIITNYIAIQPLMIDGYSLLSALNEGRIYAQPEAEKSYRDALTEAVNIADNLVWDIYASDEIDRVINVLSEATAVLKRSVALCYPLGTAKVLADQIGGLSDNEAYKSVVALLNENELDAVDADMAVKELQAVCLDAMTPEVLAKATEENPFNMTTFVVNPNIYQDAVDENEQPISSRINGWTCESNADGTHRTNHLMDDSYLVCYSWSSNEWHNISSATNYRQVVGTQIGEEGKYKLPTGSYRVEAATILDHNNDFVELYAQTNDVEISTVPDINGNDSIVYTYTEDRMEKTPFNPSWDEWNAAQNKISTTTAIRAIYVDKGAVTIGCIGHDIVRGNGSQWWADNFRLYYVSNEDGVNVGEVVKDAERVESEIVDVYDITGKLVRKQVKRADAVKGLRKGIYVVDGKKYVVAGN